MSTHSNWLQPALKPITMCYSVVSPEIVMPDAYICGRLRRTKITRKASDAAAAFSSKSISSCSILSPEIIMHDNAYIGERSENNTKCIAHDNLGWKNRTTRYILPRHCFTSDFLSFIDVELIWFFHGALQLSYKRFEVFFDLTLVIFFVKYWNLMELLMS